MKLPNEIVDYISNVVKTANIVAVDSVIIEPNMVRSINDDRTVGIYSNKDVPDVPFGSIGLTRIQDLSSRFAIAKEVDNFSVEVDGNDEHITMFKLNAKGLKIEYRCGDPGKLRAPKVLNDVECYKVKLSEGAVSLFQKGLSAMSADEVSIVSNDGVSFEFSDLSHDIYSYQFADTVDLIPNEDGEVPSTNKFVHRYHAKTLLALFKNNPEATFTVGQKGMLRFPLNNMTVFVLPSV